MAVALLIVPVAVVWYWRYYYGVLLLLASFTQAVVWGRTVAITRRCSAIYWWQSIFTEIISVSSVVKNFYSCCDSQLAPVSTKVVC